jgi:hypothetical protein
VIRSAYSKVSAEPLAVAHADQNAESS